MESSLIPRSLPLLTRERGSGDYSQLGIGRTIWESPIRLLDFAFHAIVTFQTTCDGPQEGWGAFHAHKLATLLCCTLRVLAEICLRMRICVQIVIVTGFETFKMPRKLTKVTRPPFPHEGEGTGDYTRRGRAWGQS